MGGVYGKNLQTWGLYLAWFGSFFCSFVVCCYSKKSCWTHFRTHWTGGAGRGSILGKERKVFLGPECLWLSSGDKLFSIFSSGCFHLPNGHLHLLAKQSACLWGKKKDGMNECSVLCLEERRRAPTLDGSLGQRPEKRGCDTEWASTSVSATRAPLKTMGNPRPTGPLSQWRALWQSWPVEPPTNLDRGLGQQPESSEALASHGWRSPGLHGKGPHHTGLDPLTLTSAARLW